MSPALPQVVVLAGGLGTRLGELGRNRPKVLQPVMGRPFVDFMLAPLVEQGFRRYVFCLGHLADQVVAHLRPRREKLGLTFHVDEEARGTGGALVAARTLLDERFLLVLGDTFLDVRYASMAAAMPPDGLGVMAVTDAATGVPRNARVKDGLVVAYDKALGSAAGWVDTGAALLERRALDLLEDTSAPTDLAALLGPLARKRTLGAYTTHERFYDIGTPRRLEEFAAFCATPRGPR